MGKKSVRVGLLGAGGICPAHILALRQIPQVEIIAIADRAFARATQLQQSAGIPQAFPSLDEMLSQGRPDVVHILVNPPAHAETAIRCLESGCHVFVEKPFGLSVDECRRVAAAAQNAGRKVGVNHNMAYHPTFTTLIRAVEQRRLGALEHVSVCYNGPVPVMEPYSHWIFQGLGNAIFEVAVHPLSMVYRLLGPAEAVTALPSGPVKLPSGGVFYDTWQLSLVCLRGTAAIYLSIGKAFDARVMQVIGEDAVASVDLVRNTVHLNEKSHLRRPADDLKSSLSAARGFTATAARNYGAYLGAAIGRKPLPNAMAESVRVFYNALERGEDPPVGIVEGTAVVQACEAALSTVAGQVRAISA